MNDIDTQQQPAMPDQKERAKMDALTSPIVATDGRLKPNTLIEMRLVAKTLCFIIPPKSGGKADKNVPVPHSDNHINQLVACGMYGLDIGLSFVEGAKNVGMMHGKPVLAASSQQGLVQQSKVCEYIKATTYNQDKPNELYVIAEGKRADNGVELKVRVDRRDCTNNPNETQYPGRVTRARAIKFLIRDLFADVIAGTVLDEFEAEEIEQNEKAYEQPAAPAVAAPTITMAKPTPAKAKPKKAAPPKPEPKPEPAAEPEPEPKPEPEPVAEPEPPQQQQPPPEEDTPPTNPFDDDTEVNF